MSWLESLWYGRSSAPYYLKPLASLYCLIARNKKKRDLSVQWQPPVPLIVVGNISAGGTGKTPLTVFLVEELKRKGYKPGIVSRGYKSSAPQYPFDVSLAASPKQSGDEPYMLHKRCACPVVIDADRCAATKFLLDKYDCDLIISDDGLQHYRLGRDIEIAVIDSQRGLGNKHCIPAGPLREVPERLDSVDYIVCNGGGCDFLASKLGAYTMMLEPTSFKSCDTHFTVPLNEFAATNINAVAGIGNPKRFFETLDRIVNKAADSPLSAPNTSERRVEIACYPKPDHYKFSQDDFVFTKRGAIVMTEKDAVKIEGFALENAWYLEVAARLPDTFISAIIAQLNEIEIVKGKKKNG